MGFLDDDENHSDKDSRKNSYLSDGDDTQEIGSSDGEGADDYLYLSNTMPVDDTYLLEDAFETQWVNVAGETQDVDLDWETQAVDLAGETQAMDLAGETQAVDLSGETQVMDLAGETQPLDLAGETQAVDLRGETQAVDLAGGTQVVDLAEETQVLDYLDCMKNMPVELLNVFNAEVGAFSKLEGTKKTEVLHVTQELSQDDSVKTNGSGSVGPESIVDNRPPKQGDNASGIPSDVCSNEEYNSGKVFQGFTSLRAASIRASGLAARKRGASSNLRSTSSDKSSVEQQTCDRDGSSLVESLLDSGAKNDQECLQNGYNGSIEDQRNSNRRKVGSTAMRKLFREDEVAEVGLSEPDNNHTDDNLNMPELLASESCLAGLSYANSQEPGELSQANALEVVDRFLELNVMECDESLGTRVHNAEKQKVVSGAKGSRDLAKSSNLQTTNRECGIYDWDDTREDEGGGDFFLKKREIFFDQGGRKQICLTEPRKPKCPELGNVKAVGNKRNEKGRKCTKNKSGNSVYYLGSGFMPHKLRAKGKSLNCGEEVLQKNLMKDFDGQLNAESGTKLADNDTNKDVPDMENIGPDTQMAAEAMETLCFEMHLADSNRNCPSEGAQCTGKATRKNQLSNRLTHLEKSSTPETPYPASVGVLTRQAKRIKRASINDSDESSLTPKQSKKSRKRCDTVPGETEKRRQGAGSTGKRSEKKHKLGEQLDSTSSLAHRTRKCRELNSLKAAGNSVEAREEIHDLMSARVLRKRRTSRNVEMVTVKKVRKVGSSGVKRSNKNCAGIASASDISAVDNPQGTRSLRETLFVEHEADTQYIRKLRSREVAGSISLNSGRRRSNHSSTEIHLPKTVDTECSRKKGAHCDTDNVNATLNDAVGASTSDQCDEKSDDETSAEGAETTGRPETSPRERCATPATRAPPINNVSPICMGDEYRSQSCRKNLSRLSLIREMNNLVTSSPGPYVRMKDSRKRKDITNIRVLFSQHLDADVVKQQKKILARLGGAVASCMLDATHFVADEFVRTRNMLEAIAFGKPVVTQLWLDSCGEANCLIDEKNYILRDVKKEKEFGFCLPVSLERASQHPLLQGQKVLVTPNTKPGKDILTNLVKAVHGVAVERLGRSVLKDEKLPDDLLILSCEEDYDICVPILEKGGAVYSSELLLNGIVKQKLEYERHRLFADHVKRTRSTIWLKKKNQYLPVTKCK